MLKAIIIMLACQFLLQFCVWSLLGVVGTALQDGAQRSRGQGHPIDRA